MNSTDTRSRFEYAANIATVFVAVLISASLMKVYFIPANWLRSVPPPLPPAISEGTSLTPLIQGIDWRRNKRTIILGISTHCHFCTESAPFYRRLQSEIGEGVKVVAVLSEPVEEAANYLTAEGVKPDGIKRVLLQRLGVRGTPTMMLVDERGRVSKVWAGKVQDADQNKVLEEIRSAAGIRSKEKQESGD
jgi:hypothetical protein